MESFHPVPRTETLLARMSDGRSMIIMIHTDVKIYTLERKVIQTAGLMTRGPNLQLIEMVENDVERCDLMFAEVGVTKPRLVTVLCRVCGSLLSETYSFKRHIVLHENDGVIVCSDCGGAFRDRYFYTHHLSKCFFFCPFVNSARSCQFKDKNEASVKNHVRGKHSFDKLTP